MAFLIAACDAGVSFESTLMLGRQSIIGDERDIAMAFADANRHIELDEAHRILEEGEGWSEPFFRRLGARQVESVDASGYEGCTIVHDLNHPLPDGLRGRYSAVIDGGTLEHVFNFPVALRSAIGAVRVGGHYLAISPVNNHFGHGFYQISPELYYRLLAADNGYHVRAMLMRGYNSGARWHQVADASAAGHRVIALSSWPVVLYTLAVRIEEKDLLASFPQQSDYVAVWGRSSPTAAERRMRQLRRRLSRAEPLPLKKLRFTVGTSVIRRTVGDFRAVKLADLPGLVDQ